MTHHNEHFGNPMELLSKTKFWACLGNNIILTEIINVFKFCVVGWLVQSLSPPKNITNFFVILTLGPVLKLICACNTTLRH